MSYSIAARRFLALALITLAALAIATAACNKPRPPTVDVWERQWRDLQRALPSRQEILSSDDPRAVCSAALARARTAEKDLFPAPDEVIGNTARAWFRAMLGAYMRCETEGHHDELDASFEHAARIEQELEAALKAARR